MRHGSSSDQLAHAFTDLMTSLMVIFILLLLVFLNNQANGNTTTTQALLREMKESFASSGLRQENIKLDPKDPLTIVVAVPDEQLTFQPNRHELNLQGQGFVHREMPRLAGILCAPKYRDSVENVIIEGHSDSTPYRSARPEESASLNLKLSQDRSMEVVKETLNSLTGAPAERSCFLEKLSAAGRGEQDLLPTAEKSRRVVIKVRVNAPQGMALSKTIGGKVEPGRPGPVVVLPATTKVLSLLSRLQAVPRQQVSFQLTQDEINQYLAYALRTNPRPGIDSIWVKVFPHNYISTFTIIDFDTVAHWNPILIPPPLRSILQGKRSVLIDYRFHVQDSKAAFTIEKAFYQNIHLPQFLVRQIIQSIAIQQPEAVDTDGPVPLPLGLKDVKTGEGVVTGTN